MFRLVTAVITLVLLPVVAATAQLSGGFGPTGRASISSSSTAWDTDALLGAAARFDSPFAMLDVEGALQRMSRTTRLGTFAVRHQLFTPSRDGLRGVASLEFSRASEPIGEHRLIGTASLVRRHGVGGSWVGLRADRGTTSALRFGSWRQWGERLTVAISSSLRRATVGGTPARYWTEKYVDSTWTDTAGWQRWEWERTFGDSGTVGRTRSWLETEAHLGTVIGRLAIDGAFGWRPALDSARSSGWGRVTGTAAIGRGVALSLGVGSTTHRIPYSRATGTYGFVGLRLAPPALVRPTEIPEITAVPAAFRLEPVGKGEYVARVRLPRARTVELSGDFNGWQPVPLTRQRDAWVVSIALAPGTYRMNLRVDGERWLPPPGTPAVDDEFNGKVGLVVVR